MLCIALAPLATECWACRHTWPQRATARSAASASSLRERCTRLHCWTCVWATATGMEVGGFATLVLVTSGMRTLASCAACKVPE